MPSFLGRLMCSTSLCSLALPQNKGLLVSKYIVGLYTCWAA